MPAQGIILDKFCKTTPVMVFYVSVNQRTGLRPLTVTPLRRLSLKGVFWTIILGEMHPCLENRRFDFHMLLNNNSDVLPSLFFGNGRGGF